MKTKISVSLFVFLLSLAATAQVDMTYEEPAPALISYDATSYSSGLSGALQMFLALGAVVLLAYLVLHKGLGSVLRRQRSGNLIKVKERLSLDGKNALLLVEIEDKSFLLATSDRGVQVLSTTAKGE
jgi:flagellar biogenesis protein FliO